MLLVHVSTFSHCDNPTLPPAPQQSGLEISGGGVGPQSPNKFKGMYEA